MMGFPVTVKTVSRDLGNQPGTNTTITVSNSLWRTDMRRTVIALALSLGTLVHAQTTNERTEFEFDRRIAATSKSYRPKSGYAPDSATAIAIARAVLISVYGQKTIADEEPLRAELKGGVWTVIGTLKANYIGGTAVLQLRKDTAGILFVTHMQ
jgi:hypothetical protein